MSGLALAGSSTDIFDNASLRSASVRGYAVRLRYLRLRYLQPAILAKPPPLIPVLLNLVGLYLPDFLATIRCILDNPKYRGYVEYLSVGRMSRRGSLAKGSMRPL